MSKPKLILIGGTLFLTGEQWKPVRIPASASLNAAASPAASESSPRSSKPGSHPLESSLPRMPYPKPGKKHSTGGG